MNNMRKKSKFQERLELMARKNMGQTPSTQDDPSSQSAQHNINHRETKIISVNDLHQIIDHIDSKIIPIEDMPKDPDDRDEYYGFNTAINQCSNYLKKIARDSILKLYDENKL